MSNTGKTASAKRAGTRRTQVAASVVVALGLCLAYAYSAPFAAGTPTQTIAAKATSISAATEVCPIVIGSSQDSMAAFTPASSDKTPGTATVTQLGGGSTPLATLTAPGDYGTAQNLSGSLTNLKTDSLPLVGQAEGGLAPGFTLDGVLESGSSGTEGYGLAGAACVQPDTSFWYIGAGTDANPVAQLNMADTDTLTAQIDLAEYSSNGLMSGTDQSVNQGVVVQAGGQASPPGLLIDPGKASPGAIALHLTATTGRVTAQLLASDSKGGGQDFIQSQVPATSLVIPGIPAPGSGSSMKLQLMLMATTQDADVTLKWIGNSSFTPSVTVPHLSAGHVQSVDISSIPAAGESGALEIDSTGGTPIIGAIKLTKSSGGSTDTAYLTPVGALSGDSVVAMNRSGSSVILTNQSAQPAEVQVATVSQSGTTPPSTADNTVTVPATSSLAVPLNAPSGSTQFAIVVTPLDGASQVYAARVMTGSGPLITIQPMATALESVQIPPVRADMSGTVPQN
jgi:Family of unknown function (DUF5719)